MVVTNHLFFSLTLHEKKSINNAATKVEISATIVLFIGENDCHENEINVRVFEVDQVTEADALREICVLVGLHSQDSLNMCYGKV